MSSNMQLKKRCEFCHSVFIAKKTNTKYCSHNCARQKNKVLKRDEKIKAVEEQFISKSKELTIEEVNKKEFLTVKELSLLLNISRRTLYRLIQSQKLNAFNFSERTTVVRRKDVEALFDLKLQETEVKKEMDIAHTLENSYSISEVSIKYNISHNTVKSIIKKFSLPKKIYGKHVLIKKTDIDNILNHA